MAAKRAWVARKSPVSPRQAAGSARRSPSVFCSASSAAIRAGSASSSRCSLSGPLLLPAPPSPPPSFFPLPPLPSPPPAPRPVGGLARACRQVVGVAARVFAPDAVAQGRDRLRDDVVEEHAVVADDQDRGRIVGEQFLEQFERLDVEVVGRFVEHQQVGGPREQARQQQPVALAARQRAHRRARALGREQESLEIAHHVRAASCRSRPTPSRG